MLQRQSSCRGLLGILLTLLRLDLMVEQKSRLKTSLPKAFIALAVLSLTSLKMLQKLATSFLELLMVGFSPVKKDLFQFNSNVQAMLKKSSMP